MAQTEKLTTVGKRVTRLNGPDIVTGRIAYADDVQLPGMLYGRISDFVNLPTGSLERAALQKHLDKIGQGEGG